MWYNKYIGLPYKDNGRTTAGIDCWGLACLVYREHFDIELPTLDGAYLGSQDLVIKELVAHTKESWIPTNDPKPGDICVFNILGEPTHVGIYLGDGMFLHARAGQDSVIELLDSHRWNRRLEGIYSYNPGKIQLTGAPHPLQLQNVVTDWAPAGTSIYQLTQYIQEKYRVSTRLMERIIILVDGVPVQQQNWQTTRLLPGQTIAYRVMATGGSSGRMLMTLALVVAVSVFTAGAGAVGGFGSFMVGATGFGTAAGWAVAAGIGLNMAGMALINAIAPIKPPKQETPGASLNLFSGSSNQINRFGAIPVVLGKVRMTAVHGATPYVESLTDTSVISMALIWGFGPLDVSDIQVGLVPIEQFYGVDLRGSTDQVVPKTLYGYANEDTTAFDRLYGQDVTQQIVNTDLVNDYYLGTSSTNPPASTSNPAYRNPETVFTNDITGGAWKEVALTEPCTRIELAFNFPQGLRSLKAPNEVQTAVAMIEVQYKAEGQSWADVIPFTNNQTTSTTSSGSASSGWTATLRRPDVVQTITTVVENDVSSLQYSTQQTFQWHVITLQSGGGINVYDGTPTFDPNTEPDQTLIDIYKNTQYNSLGAAADLSAQYTRIPVIPSNHIELYRICLTSALGTGASIFYAQEDKRSLSGTVTGLDLTKTEDTSNGTLKININTGNISNSAQTAITSTTQQEKFSVKDFASTSSYSIIVPATQSTWYSFLQDYGRWCSYNATSIVAGKTYKIATLGNTNWTSIGAPSAIVGTVFVATGVGNGTGTVYTTTCDITQTWTVLASEAGVYTVYASADNTAQVFVDDNLVLSLNGDSYSTIFSNSVLITAGTHTVRIVGTNADITTPSAVAVKFTITQDGQNSANVAAKTILSWGAAGTDYEKKKDAFNATYSIRDLPPALYTVRVRRYNYSFGGNDVPESGGFNRYDKSILYSVTGYSSNKPITNPPGCYLARTAIRLQSTNKVNGNVDGINALVQTRGYDVVYTNNGATKTWTPNLPINNPASLFRYVLQHPANMYAVADSDIDLTQLAEWHNFCKIKKLTYNNVLTSTQSVMDTLREICAAGLASPTMINGKWSVVVDKPRTYVTQHFTPHNSWGFESTKALPKIPDGFRVTINNESKAYQPDEFFVFRESVTSETAKIYEQLSLPGVTNKAQATYLAKWHFAQLKLRPETYRLNVDFEYLVCTRGDLVRVSHDIPQWGTGNGRVSSLSYNAQTGNTTVTLTEEVYLDTAKNYTIRFRTNSSTFYSLANKTLVSYTTGYTNSITVHEDLITLGVEADNLYMLGELVGTTAKDSQELVVLSIEPTSNTSAVLTLTDYSSQIYLEDFQNLVYDPGITGSNNDVIVNSITDVPILQEATSDSALAELSSPGVYTNILKLSIAHPSGLSQIAQKLQIQYVDGTESLNSDSMGLNLIVDKTASAGIEIRGLVSGQPYKFRARYLNNLGTIRGPWSSPPFTAVVVGKKTNNLVPPAITVELDDYWLVITPSDNGVQNDQDFKTFEYRAYKSSGTATEDFWDLGTSLSTIKFVQSRSASRIDLRTFDQPRISETGVQYRIGCRVLDNNNNYSSTTTLNSFILKTIVEEDPEDTN